MYGSSKAAPPYWKNDCEQMDDCGIYHRICNSGGPNFTDKRSNPTERYDLAILISKIHFFYILHRRTQFTYDLFLDTRLSQSSS